jgi:glycosyltransferase involved in cell wall biosynthesis
LYTGYAKYGKEVLSRLAATEKYDLAELACFGKIGDPRDVHATWKYYPNHVDEKHPLFKRYLSNPQNEFGKWRFERTCLDFKPDIVIDIRDPWMLTFEDMSPFREFYHWAIMPTVDSAPQKDEWLEIFSGADGVFTYSDWGKDVLDREGGGSINTINTAPPGCNTDTFFPVQDKKAHRNRMGFFKDANVIGTIMRNQTRKLYPDLFQSFRIFIDQCYDRGEKELAENTYLYVHCSYPDVGWEIPMLLREHGLGRKVIFTYICNGCKVPFCSFFRDSKTVCPNCNKLSAILPNTGLGLTQHQLAQVLNIFDVYIQYSVCEGFGMPQVEAASCGVPLMSVDYSAMSDVVRKTKGVPLKVERMFRDMGTHSYRALPDNEACAEEIFKFFRKPQAIRRRMGREARKAVEKHYTWDNTAKIWESYLDNVELTGLQGQWDSPRRKVHRPPEIADIATNADFIDWCVTKVMQEPRLLNSRFAMRCLRELNYGGRPSDRNIVPVDRLTTYRRFRNYCENKLECEDARTGAIELDNMDFIEYAHRRAKYL